MADFENNKKSQIPHFDWEKDWMLFMLLLLFFQDFCKEDRKIDEDAAYEEKQERQVAI